MTKQTSQVPTQETAFRFITAVLSAVVILGSITNSFLGLLVTITLFLNIFGSWWLYMVWSQKNQWRVVAGVACIIALFLSHLTVFVVSAMILHLIAEYKDGGGMWDRLRERVPSELPKVEINLDTLSFDRASKALSQTGAVVSNWDFRLFVIVIAMVVINFTRFVSAETITYSLINAIGWAAVVGWLWLGLAKKRKPFYWIFTKRRMLGLFSIGMVLLNLAGHGYETVLASFIRDIPIAGYNGYLWTILAVALVIIWAQGRKPSASVSSSEKAESV